MKTTTSAAAILAVLTAVPVPAQVPDEDEAAEGEIIEVEATDEDPVEVAPIIVESAFRTETPIDEATRSVTVVTSEEIREQKAVTRNVGDILSQTTPGFSPSTEAQTDFGQTLRGRPFLTLIDGVPQTTPLRDGRRSLNSIDAEAIERIEVVRGGTALYGFGAQGGLVNIITKRPEEGEFNARARAGLGFSATHPDDSFRWEAGAGASGRIGGVDYLADASFLDRDDFFDADGDRLPADPTGAQGGLSDSDVVNLLGKVGYNWDNDRQRVQLSGLYYDFEQDPDFGGISFEGDPDRNVKTPAVRGNPNPTNPGTENVNVNLEYTHEDVFGSEVEAQLYYADLDVAFGKFPGFQQTRIESEKVGGRLTIETPVAFDPLPFTVAWGVDALTDTTAQTGIGEGFSVAAPELDQEAFAGFAQVEVPLGDVALVTGGVRHEVIDVHAPDFLQTSGNLVEGGTIEFDETVFNLSGTVFLTDALDLYGGFSQSFNIPELGRVIRTFPFDRAEQAETEAETIDHYELGLRYIENRWDASIVGFFNESDNGTSFDQNLDIVKAPEEIWGVEVAANARPTDRLGFGGTLTWMEGQVDLDDDGDFEEDLPTTRIPPLKVTGHVEYQVADWWNARVQGLYSGERDPDSTQFGGTGDIEDYVVFDVYSSFAVGPGDLEVGVQNLFNNEYTPVLNQAYDLSFAFARAPGTSITAAYELEF